MVYDVTRLVKRLAGGKHVAEPVRFCRLSQGDGERKREVVTHQARR